jgi:hypothetical protein
VTVEPLDFEEFVDLLRRRIRAAEAVGDGQRPSFTTLMEDYAEVTPANWYHEAFDELEAQGHLDLRASGKTFGNPPDCFATLSADGRYYLRHEDDAD